VTAILVGARRGEHDPRMVSTLVASGVRLVAVVAMAVMSLTTSTGAAASPAAPSIALCTRTLMAGRASAVWVEPCHPANAGRTGADGGAGSATGTRRGSTRP
jgi:hypothetical protein